MDMPALLAIFACAPAFAFSDATDGEPADVEAPRDSASPREGDNVDDVSIIYTEQGCLGQSGTSMGLISPLAEHFRATPEALRPERIVFSPLRRGDVIVLPLSQTTNIFLFADAFVVSGKTDVNRDFGGSVILGGASASPISSPGDEQINGARLARGARGPRRRRRRGRRGSR